MTPIELAEDEENRKKTDLICNVEIDYKGVPIVSSKNYKRFGSDIDDFGVGSIETGSACTSPLLLLTGQK